MYAAFCTNPSRHRRRLPLLVVGRVAQFFRAYGLHGKVCAGAEEPGSVGRMSGRREEPEAKRPNVGARRERLSAMLEKNGGVGSAERGSASESSRTRCSEIFHATWRVTPTANVVGERQAVPKSR